MESGGPVLKSKDGLIKVPFPGFYKVNNKSLSTYYELGMLWTFYMYSLIQSLKQLFKSGNCNPYFFFFHRITGPGR